MVIISKKQDHRLFQCKVKKVKIILYFIEAMIMVGVIFMLFQLLTYGDGTYGDWSIIFKDEVPRQLKVNNCETKWKQTYNPNITGLARPFVGNGKILPPFTSGDLPICHLKSLTRSPIPVILVSKGRSGSSSTWQVLSKLTGHCSTVHEYTGGNSVEEIAFFSRIKPGDNGNWILNNLCEQQIKYSDKGGIIGFQWKPFHKGIKKEDKSLDGLDGLKMIAHHTNPQIKIVRSRRNPLDIILSHQKWRLLNLNGFKNRAHGYAHCSSNNTACINAHKKYGTNIHLTPETILDKLRTMIMVEERVDRNLEDLNVPHIKVSYEKLYHSNDAEEWMRIFRFLERGPGSNLSKKKLEEAMEHAGTGIPSHNVSISNYKEIWNTLMGTELEHLLH